MMSQKKKKKSVDSRVCFIVNPAKESSELQDCQEKKLRDFTKWLLKPQAG